MSTRVFDLLVRESRNSDRVKSSHHAAALVYKNRILAVGHNRRKTHPLMSKFQTNPKRINLHAEIDCCISGINQYGIEILKDCTLYVLRTTKTGRVASSEPCEGCWRFINHVGIKKVYWS